MITNKKLVISHNHWEFYHFAKAISYGDRRPPQCVRAGPKQNKLENRKLSFRRSKKNLRRLVNTNAKTINGPNGEKYTFKFLTLTFKEELQDIKKANYLFKKFIQRFSYHIYKKENKLMYVAVIEFQKRGAIHYHLILFNIPYTKAKIINKIWSRTCEGGVHIKKIDNVQNIGSYICKYMSKNLDDARLCGEKAYFTSRNLEKPKIICDWKFIEIIEEMLPEKDKLYEMDFDSKFCGKSTYALYNLTDNQKIKNQALAFLRL